MTGPVAGEALPPGAIDRRLVASCWTWAGNARPAWPDERSPHDLATRLAAITGTGFHGVGLVHADLVEIRRTVGLATARRMIDDAGLAYVEVEFLSDWWTTGERRRASDRVRHELFEAATALGARTVKVAGELDHLRVGEPVPRDAMVTAFAALAADAAGHGLRVALEPLPMSDVRTLADGVDIVTGAAHPAGGLTVDVWHVARGGTSYEEVRRLPIGSVFVVELDDASAQVVGSLWDDTLDRRLLPGHGDLAVDAFVRALHDAGWRGPWGVEMISADFRALPLPVALAAVRESTLAVIDAAESASAAGSRTAH
ncbi:sugar phosphate isomerase/epimerase family protein [Nakamurella deserti]|uniref:sugar phosphate isomerase/epimerase family protein n=1 Tax=Nakamurella deserti TaxID=2164074 RepID=UPI00197B93BA|nr:sugar phosphate isomerase/epimerase [Nakamurella deserti]